MKIACLGGGPAGLYFAISMKLRDAAHDITVFERNKPDDTFGWGVVLSDETFENLAANDPLSAGDDPRAISPIGTTSRSIIAARRSSRAATAFPASRARSCCMLLQQRARALGVDLRFQTEIASAAELAKTYDLVVAADGLNSRTRNEFADHFKPAIETAQEQIRLARHPPEIRRRLHLHLRGDRARLDLGARLSVRRRHRDLHRRMRRRRPGKNSASAR